MRFAGSPEIFEALQQHFASDGVPAPANAALAAEVVAHGPAADTSIENFTEAFQQLKAMGYDDQAAQLLAVEALEQGSLGGQPEQNYPDP